MKQLRKEMQLIFQDPFSSLNPRITVSRAIDEALKLTGRYRDADERFTKILELMETVGLDERLASAYPHELDGGCRQRVGIARALAMEPEFIVCDEPVSALDVSIQAQMQKHDPQSGAGERRDRPRSGKLILPRFTALGY